MDCEQQGKRSSESEELPPIRCVKRQLTDRTITAHMLEDCLHFGRETPSIQARSSAAPAIDDECGIHIQQHQQQHHQQHYPHQEQEEQLQDETESQEFPFSFDDWGDNTDFCLAEGGGGDDEEGECCQGEDEADGLRDVGRKLKDVIHHIADECSSIIQAFKVLLHRRHLRTKFDDQPDDDGFSVHLPGHFFHSDPVHLGARLRRAENGYLLLRVFPDTVAHKVGLRDTDVITHLNNIDLHVKDVPGVLKTFMAVEKNFSVTILRMVGEGDSACLIPMTVQITITVNAANTVIGFEVIVTRSSHMFCVASQSDMYITQEDGGTKYLKAQGHNQELQVDTVHAEEAMFQIDYYTGTHLGEGQNVVIRHCKTSNANLAYHATENKMMTFSSASTDNAFVLNKWRQESMVQERYLFRTRTDPVKYLHKSGSGDIKLGSKEDALENGLFQILDAN